MKVGDYRLAHRGDARERKLAAPCLGAQTRLAPPRPAMSARLQGLTRRKRRPFLRARGARMATLKAKGFHTMSLHAQTIPNQPAIQPLPEQPAQPDPPSLPPEIPVPTDPPLGTPPLEVPPEQAPQHT